MPLSCDTSLHTILEAAGRIVKAHVLEYLDTIHGQLNQQGIGWVMGLPNLRLTGAPSEILPCSNIQVTDEATVLSVEVSHPASSVSKYLIHLSHGCLSCSKLLPQPLLHAACCRYQGCMLPPQCVQILALKM